MPSTYDNVNKIIVKSANNEIVFTPNEQPTPVDLDTDVPFIYLGYATYTSGDTLPSTTTDETHTLTWYASVEDAIAQTNPITIGNGNEVYARAVAV